MKRLILCLLFLTFLALECFAGSPIQGVVARRRVASGGTETIGVETPGASSDAAGASALYVSSLDTAVHTGIFQTISLYFSCSSSTTDIKFGLYKGATASTAVLVGSLEWSDPGVLSAGWHTLDVSAQNWVAEAGQSYWIGFVVSAASYITYYYDESSSGSGYYKTAAYLDPWPNPYGTSTTSTKLRSMKATIAY